MCVVCFCVYWVQMCLNVCAHTVYTHSDSTESQSKCLPVVAVYQMETLVVAVEPEAFDFAVAVAVRLLRSVTVVDCLVVCPCSGFVNKYINQIVVMREVSATHRHTDPYRQRNIAQTHTESHNFNLKCKSMHPHFIIKSCIFIERQRERESWKIFGERKLPKTYLWHKWDIYHAYTPCTDRTYKFVAMTKLMCCLLKMQGSGIPQKSLS